VLKAAVIGTVTLIIKSRSKKNGSYFFTVKYSINKGFRLILVEEIIIICDL